MQTETLRSLNCSSLRTKWHVVLDKAAFTDTNNTLTRRTATLVLLATVRVVCAGPLWAIATGPVNMGTHLCTLYTPIICNSSFSQKTVPTCISCPPCCHECSSGSCDSSAGPGYRSVSVAAVQAIHCFVFPCRSGDKTMREVGRLFTLYRTGKFWVQTRISAVLGNLHSFP